MAGFRVKEAAYVTLPDALREPSVSVAVEVAPAVTPVLELRDDPALPVSRERRA